VSRSWTPNKKTVELEARPSRIRREPVRSDKPADAVKWMRWDPSEREAWIVVAGVVLFALAVSAVVIGISQVTS
jgi:hypothetical protein